MKAQWALAFVLLGCHRRAPSVEAAVTSDASEIDASPSEAGVVTRHVRAPEQGTVGETREEPLATEAPFADGSATLRVESNEGQVQFVLARGGSAPQHRRVREELVHWGLRSLVATNGIALYGEGARPVGIKSVVAWTTRRSSTLRVQLVESELVRVGSRLLFVGNDCMLHAFDAERGVLQSGPRVACRSALKLFGTVVVVGTPELADRLVVGFTFPDRGFDAETFAPVSAPCQFVAGRTCVRFASETEIDLDDDPPVVASEHDTFQVVGGDGTQLYEGRITIEKAAEGRQVTVWKNATSSVLGLVADVEPSYSAATLLLVHDGRVETRRLSQRELVDQRLVPELQTMVPYPTPPEAVEALLHARAGDAERASHEWLQWQ